LRSFDRRLLRTAGAARVALVAAVLLGILTAALAIAQAALLADAVSSAFLGGATVAALGGVLAALAVVLLARAVAGWATESIAQRCSAAVKSSLRRRVLAAAMVPGPEASDR
jgi:ABC-type transport system involved in cytochrome bd biosynthesis fused ATPase/permease subunit